MAVNIKEVFQIEGFYFVCGRECFVNLYFFIHPKWLYALAQAKSLTKLPIPDQYSSAGLLDSAESTQAP